jgi:branched-chain amino acid transport system permease protein
MCVGAFTGAFFSKCFYGTIPDALCFLGAIIVGAACAALFGLIIGIPVLRLRGDYLAIVTLAFGEIIKNIINVIYVGRDSSGFHFALNQSTKIKLGDGGEMIVKGAQGITGTPQFSNFTIGVVLLLITLIVALHLINSRTGRAVMAIRDDRIAAEATGINVTKYKLMAFIVSATLAGVGGVLYAHNLPTLMATSAKFGYNMSIMILVFVVLGGIGSTRGSMIAAIVLTLLPEMLRGLADYRMLVYSIVLIIAMLFNWSPKSLELREKYSLKRLFKKKGATKNGNA